MVRIKITPYCLLWLIVLWPLAASADELSLTLEQAIDQALREAPQIVASTAMLEGAAAVAPSAGRLPDPELVTAVDNLPVNTADRFSFTRDFMTMRRVGVMQSFPNHEKRRLLNQQAEGEIAVARGELRKAQFDTARAVAEAWISSAVAEQSLARLRNLKSATQLQAGAGRAALASGRASAAEALAAQSLDASLDERMLSFEQDAQMKRAELARWLGAAGDRALAPIPADRELGHSIEALMNGVPEHAPLAPLVAQLEVARTEVALARADKRPDWSAALSYSQRGPAYSNMVSLEFRIGLPLFASSRQNPRIAEKLAAVRAQEAERDGEIRMHTAEVRAALAQWRIGRERLQHLASELLPLQRDRARAALASYSAGRGDLRSALEALTEEIGTELDDVQLQGSVARAWVFLHLLHNAGTVK